MISRRLASVSLVMLLSVVTMVGWATPSAAATAATVSITSPVSGATVKGTVSIDVTAQTSASSGDSPNVIEVFVDGVLRDTQGCEGQSPTSCTVTTNWDASGLTNAHTLSARLTTVGGLTITSSSVSVVVSSPAPSVVITSPVAGASVRGVVTVAVSTSTDASQSDEPSRVDLFVDGVFYASADCGIRAVPRLCDVTFDWDVSGLTGRHALVAQVTTSASPPVTRVSGSVSVVVSSPAPSVVITSPVAGASVRGVVTVAVSTSTDASQSDEPSRVDLFVDGVFYASADCGIRAVPRLCDVTFDWDVSGLTGRHALVAQVTTSASPPVTRVSGSVSVVVSSPAPSVVITSPVAGASVRGVVTVAVSTSTSTDASQSDEPSRVDLFVDGVFYASADCGIRAVPRLCDVTFDWDVSGTSGQHVLVAQVNTAAGDSAVTSKKVWAWSGTRMSVRPAAAARAGAAVTLTGHVVATVDDANVAGAAVKVTLVPAVGAARTFTVRTSSTGTWSTKITPLTNTTVRVNLAASPGYGASSTSAVQSVRAPITTRLSATTIRKNGTLRVVSSVKSLPRGTRVSLQLYSSGVWRTVSTVSAPGTSFTFTPRFARAGVVRLRVRVAASRPYVATIGPVKTLTVR